MFHIRKGEKLEPGAVFMGKASGRYSTVQYIVLYRSARSRKYLGKHIMMQSREFQCAEFYSPLVPC
jgi:hypothetical protein